MENKKFLIAPFESGLQKDVRPWLLPEDAFDELRNMYVFRGRLRKRFGSSLVNDGVTDIPEGTEQLSSRLRLSIGSTPGPLNVTGTTAGTPLKIGSMFSVGSDMFTVWQLGAGVTTLSTNVAITCTIDTTATPNTVTFGGVGAPTTVFFYPSNPVMGMTQFETAFINDEPTYIFDTQFVYYFVNNGWERLGTSTWTGTNSDFFWSSNWHATTSDINALFVTNFVAADNIKYLVGTTWTTMAPIFNVIGGVDYTIETARIIIPFNGRLLFFNTVENIGGVNKQFPSRCRYSQNGDPTIATDATTWREDIPGKGGYIDASTQEQIITVQFIKNRIIVFFERSTWELVSTGNEADPFRWQQINSELGAESTFSVIPFDKIVIGIGNVGIHACSGANVERIDDKIPDEVFNIHNENDGVKRVFGVRDYPTELVYWAFPSDDKNDVFPTQVLVYNYKNGSWALNDDSITAFGYFQNETDVTWENDEGTWQEDEAPWNSGAFQSEYRKIIAGNQQGFVFFVESNQTETSTRNAPALQITEINTATSTLTVVDHNLHSQDYIAIENLQGTTADTIIYKIDTVTTDTIVLENATLTGTYTGGGTIARVSKPVITSKQYNFFIKDGRNVEVTKIDFYLDKTVDGEFSIDYFASSSNDKLGTTIVETRPYDPEFAPLEQSQKQIWHRGYVDAEGDNFQIKIYLNDDQMKNNDITWSALQVHAIMFHASPTRSRFE